MDGRLTNGNGRSRRGEEPSLEDRVARGRLARERVPRSSQAELGLPTDRANPIDLLEAQAETRLGELVPIRHGRMLVSPFTYFRGAALPMTSDLATSEDSGLMVQACGMPTCRTRRAEGRGEHRQARGRERHLIARGDRVILSRG